MKGRTGKPKFWSDISEILDFGFYSTSKITGSVWLCLKNTYEHLQNIL